MELAVEIYNDAKLKKLVENYIEQRDQQKEITTQAAGKCAISHNEKMNVENYKNSIKFILDKTNNEEKLKKMLGWIWAIM